MNLNKTNKEIYLREVSKFFDDIQDLPEADGLACIDAQIQDMWQTKIEPTKELFDNIIKNTTYRKLKDSWIELLDNPSPRIKPKADISYSYDIKKAAFSFPGISKWAEIDKETKEPAINAKDKTTISTTLCDISYRLGKLEGAEKKAGGSLLRVIDSDHRVVEPRKGTPSAQAAEVQSTIAQMLANGDSYTSPTVINDIHMRWKNHTMQIGKDHKLDNTYSTPPVVYTNNAVLELLDPEFDKRWCTFYSEHHPDESVDFSGLKSAFDRMSEPEAVAAWFWGVYSGLYKGRQIIWLYGQLGEEGKSYLLKFLGSKLFGEDHGFKSVGASNIGGKSAFTTSNYVGARLVGYPDCNNPNILATEMCKTLSGGGRDSVYTEEKYEPGQTATLLARMIILSNKLPNVQGDNWYLSRLMYVSMDAFKGEKDPDIDKKYEAELNGFLYWAKECYEKLCPNHEAIQLKAETVLTTQKMIGSYNPLEEDVFNSLFVMDPTAIIKIKDIRTALQEDETFRNVKDTKDWFTWLDNQPGIEKTYCPLSHRKNQYTGFKFNAYNLPPPTLDTNDWGDDDAF